MYNLPMDIYHRISISSITDSEIFKENNVVEILKNWKVKYKKLPYPRSSEYMISFDIYESNSHWSDIKKLFIKDKALDIYETLFDEKEILQAEWLRLIPMYEHGYPQPEGNWVTKKPNYKNVCKECGTYTQATSLHIKSEPNMSKNDFMKLFWASEIFTTNGVFDLLESNKITGFERRPVLIHKTGMPSSTIAQIYMSHIAKPSLRDQDLPKIKCQTCGVIKYYPHKRGVMHLTENTLDPKLDFQLTAEWFGSGHRAYREMIVSNKVAKLLIESKLKGVRLKVVELISNVN